MDRISRIRYGESELLVKERQRVLRLLQEALPQASICEVGSTVVKGAIGKQDVDFAVLVLAHEFDAARASLDRLIQRDPDQLSTACYQGFRASSEWDIAVQLTVKGGLHDTFHEFIAALRLNPDLLRAYNELKLDWDGKPMDGYRQAKSYFIANALLLAKSRKQ